MHVYKFRLLTDTNDDFIRDIEIQAGQSFLDFHKIISQSSNLNGDELASFHICDQKWNKEKEITLIDMLEGEDNDGEKKPVEETFVMKDALIRNFIDHPHQRLLYEYDFLNMRTFFIELLSVHKQKDDGTYPRCTLKKGELEQPLPPESLLDDEEDDELTRQLISDYDDILDNSLDIKEDSENNDIKLN